MSGFKAVAGTTVVCLATCMVSATVATASTLNVCVPEKEGAAIVTPVKGACKAKYAATVLLPKAEQEKLNKVVPYMTYEEAGIGGQPTIRLSRVSLQIVDGEGETCKKPNATGNLVVGYDEHEHRTQSGSHNIVVGLGATYSSCGDLIAGQNNTVTSPFAFAAGSHAVVTGTDASVTGGQFNTASGELATVTGGTNNTASGLYSSISGGQFGRTGAEGEFASLSGGYKNTAEGRWSSIFGGKELTAPNNYEAIP